MSRMSQNDNREISKLLTHQLVKDVTKTMNASSYMGIESKIRAMIISLLENPVKQMSQHEEVITKMGESLRKNIRRTHDLEYILQRYQRATTCVDAFEFRFTELQAEHKGHAIVYDE